ncbi:MAG TPA: restriction endonuclease subunit S [Chryseobacterium sp.]|nr:restriction endonuclease subunit S [Chryseobacterium sp.]
MEKQIKIPALRFPEFIGEWQLKKFGSLTKRISNAVNVNDEELYYQIGIRSHGKGLFYKDAVTGKSLGDKRVFWVKENMFVVNIVFAWEQAVAKTTEKEIGMIASHRFPMYLPINTLSNLDYLVHFFLTKKGKFLLGLASPGGAGRNKTLGQKEFENLKFIIPSEAEQVKIANFLTAVENKLDKLKQKKFLLEQYKRGVMRDIFSKEIRLNDEFGKEFPKWEFKKFGDTANIILGQSPESDSYNSEGIGQYLIQGNADIINRKTKPRNWTSKPTKECKIGDLILTVRAPVGSVAKSTYNACIGRGVCAISNKSNSNIEYLYQFLLDYELKWVRLEQGSTFTAISGTDIRSIEIELPCLAEQTKIASFLSAIDEKIFQCQLQIEKTVLYKKGLLQKMFC